MNEPAQSAAAAGKNRCPRDFSLGRGVLLVLLVIVVYAPALRGQFVWDDLLLVGKNPLAQGDFTLRSIWFQTDFPLSTIAFWVQSLLWGKNASGFHVVNVLLHAVNSLLVWRVLARLGMRAAFLAAVFFAVHSVCVTSVAWISELKNTLSLAFFLLSLAWYLRFDEEATSEFKNRVWYWLSLGAFLLALLSKTSTVMLPVVLLGCAWWRRGFVARGDWLRVSSYFALALTFGLASVWFQQHQAIGAQAVQAENFWARLAGAGWALWFYLAKALAPLNLCLIYPRWEINPSAPLSYLPLLLWGGLLMLCWRFRRGWGRPALFALGCFTVLLLPVLGFFDMYFLAISRVSDHFEYLPLIPIVALIAAALWRMHPAKWLRAGVAAILILTLSVLTARRAQIFATDESLWLDTLAKNPASWNAHNNLGCIRAEQNRLDEAMRYFEASLQYNPRNAQAHVNLGRGRALQGRFAEADAHFSSALQLKPDDPDAHALYGLALADQRRLDDAARQLREAVRLRPEAATRMQLARLLQATGRNGEAIAQCRAILAVQPDRPEALSNLAWLLATSSDDPLREGKEAVRLAQRACELTGNKEARAVGTLAAAFAETGQFEQAVATAELAARVAQSSGDAQFAAMNAQLLQLYRAGKAYHETPAPTPRPQP